MAAKSSPDDNLLTCQSKLDEDTLTDVSSDVSSSFERDREFEILRDLAPRCSSSPTPDDVGTTSTIAPCDEASETQHEKQAKEGLFSSSKGRRTNNTEVNINRKVAVERSMRANRVTDAESGQVELTRTAGRSCRWSLLSAAEAPSAKTTSKSIIPSPRSECVKYFPTLNGKNSGREEGRYAEEDEVEAHRTGTSSGRSQQVLADERWRRICDERSSSSCGNEFCCHMLACEGISKGSRAACSKTDFRQLRGKHDVNAICSSPAPAYSVRNDGQVSKLRLGTVQGTCVLRRTQSERRESKTGRKVTRELSLPVQELPSPKLAAASERTCLDMGNGSPDTLKSSASLDSLEDKDSLMMGFSRGLHQRCDKLSRNSSFCEEGSAARARRHVLRRVWSMSDTSSSCFMTGVPPTAKETVTSRLRFEKRHQDHGQERQEYLTPTQRKDVLIRELKKQVKQLSKMLQDKDEEMEAWRARLRTETRELLATAQRETEEAMKTTALTREEVFSLRASQEESLTMMSNLRRQVDELKKQIVKKEQETEEMLQEMFKKGHDSAVFEREEEVW
ncbi:hypothetical protein C0Q70_07595 [Pomacea canaliculata]|uniref:Uncharacterized protein n=1 Tax=Pomacea canaliculata TaxID=400727 RepID=A0A2T7PFH3_POMCA|nr:hypothetical protein C0Q70_07595 [Pomacea canaliculata]